LVKARLLEMQSAKALARIGFFNQVHSGHPNSAPGHEFPELPPLMVKDLQAAFYTFAVRNPMGEPMVKANDVEKALCYAGFFNSNLGQPDIPGDLALDGFVALGRQRAFRLLTREQVEKLRSVFVRHDIDNSQKLDKDEVSGALQSLLGVEVDPPSIQSITYLYSAAAAETERGLITFDSFVAIVSWFVRLTEPKWKLVQAMRTIIPEDEPQVMLGSRGPSARVTKEQLVEHSRGRITEEEAEEMLWSSDWNHKGQGEGQWIDGQSFSCAMNTSFTCQYGDLPPEPLVDLRSWQRSPTRGIERFLKASPDTDGVNRQFAPILVAREGTTTTYSESSTVDSDAARIECAERAKRLLEEPESSRGAFCLSVVFCFFIAVSCLVILAEPILMSNVADNCKDKDALKKWLFCLEVFFTVIFGAELLARLLVNVTIDPECSTVCKFFKVPLNLCDLVAILPLPIELLMNSVTTKFSLLRLSRLVRLARLVRMAKLAKNGLPVMEPVTVVLVVIWVIYSLHEFQHPPGAHECH
jgi:Ca2+-binding EF-hand superfamily protein